MIITRRSGWVNVVESCKIMFYQGELPILLFRHVCHRMYHLATMRSITDRQTYRQHYHANSLSYCVQYDRLKIVKINRRNLYYVLLTKR